MNITSEIYQVGGAGYTSQEDGAVYLLKIGREAALVDAGCGRSGDRLFKNIQDRGVDLKDVCFLLLTHCHYDHAGGAQVIRKKTGCQVIAHRLDACFIEEGDNRVTAADWYGASMPPVSVDRKLSNPEEVIHVSDRIIHAFHVPGHSPGSVAYYMESDGYRVLFAQDVHGPLHPDLLSDRNDYYDSLQTLLALEADILCEGHLGVYKDKDAVRRFIASYQE